MTKWQCLWRESLLFSCVNWDIVATLINWNAQSLVCVSDLTLMYNKRLWRLPLLPVFGFTNWLLFSVVFLQAEFVWHKLSADNMDPDFVERRRIGLENFLLRVASHPILSNDKIFYDFLTEVSALALWLPSGQTAISFASECTSEDRPQLALKLVTVPVTSCGLQDLGVEPESFR